MTTGKACACAWVNDGWCPYCHTIAVPVTGDWVPPLNLPGLDMCPWHRTVVLYGPPTVGKSVLAHKWCRDASGDYLALEQAPGTYRGMCPVRYVDEPGKRFTVIDSVQLFDGDPYGLTAPILLLSQVTLDDTMRGGMLHHHMADMVIRIEPVGKGTKRKLIVEKERGTLKVPRTVKADLRDWFPVVTTGKGSKK